MKVVPTAYFDLFMKGRHMFNRINSLNTELLTKKLRGKSCEETKHPQPQNWKKKNENSKRKLDKTNMKKIDSSECNGLFTKSPWDYFVLSILMFFSRFWGDSPGSSLLFLGFFCLVKILFINMLCSKWLWRLFLQPKGFHYIEHVLKIVPRGIFHSWGRLVCTCGSFYLEDDPS